MAMESKMIRVENYKLRKCWVGPAKVGSIPYSRIAFQGKLDPGTYGDMYELYEKHDSINSKPIRCVVEAVTDDGRMILSKI